MAVVQASLISQTRAEKSINPMKNKKRKYRKLFLLGEEIKIARLLAGNEEKSRKRAINRLKNWFKNRSKQLAFTDEDFLRIWKGLFYSMWMSDKPLIQEECAENISNLIHSLNFESGMLYFKTGLITLIDEWIGIDQFRLDKFLMLVRRLLRQAFVSISKQSWQKSCIEEFSEALSESVLNNSLKNKPCGLILHFTEIYLEELSKISRGKIDEKLTIDFVEPFMKYLVHCDDSRQIEHIRKFIFTYLIRQSDLGLEFDEKFQAWKQLGFPGTIKNMQKVEIETKNEEIDDNEDGSRILDPRAGRVDVELPQIRFDANLMVKKLKKYKFLDGSSTKSRKSINIIIEHFEKLLSGIYPFEIKKVQNDKLGPDTSIRKAVNRLVKFDKKIIGEKNKKRKKKSMDNKNNKRIKLDDDDNDDVFLDDVDDFNESNQKIEYIFRRNSGTWFVYRDSKMLDNTSKSQSFIESDFNIIKSDGKVVGSKCKNKKSKSDRKSKKVKINTNLNQSQDVQEHHAQILSSPGIPYDANKKPVKPLLKPTLVSSPVNPFYKRLST